MKSEKSVDHKTIQQLESIAGSSPFYLVDGSMFEANFDGLTNAFASRYQPFTLAYSYKTNYIPYLCERIKHKGGWAEVVSRMEYDLAMKVGQAPDKIIFNGPVKTAADIAQALDNGSLVNLDSDSEVEAVIQYASLNPGKTVNIGLRINIGLSDEAGQSHIQQSLKVGRFGFAPADIAQVKAKLAESKNIKVVSLHGHTSTTDRSQWCFEVITQTLCTVAEQYFPDTVTMVNVGGGFFGKMHPDMPFKKTPTFDDYAQVVTDVLSTSQWIRQTKPSLMIEPGVAMVADAVSFIAKIISVKTIRDQIFVTVDGSAFHAKPTFHSINLPHEIISQEESGPEKTFSVVGSTCMEKDYLLNDITAPLPQAGDYIKIDSVGAYTIVMSPPFITPGPAILVKEADGFKRIRTRQTLDEIFSSYIFEEGSDE
jgi:diaminopimelate decarboxylase